MKKFLLALALCLLPTLASAQCNGVFPPNTLCGRQSGSGLPGQVPTSVLTGVPGGTNGQVQYNNSGAFGGFTMSGDCTIVASTGVITCTKTNGVAFGTPATGTRSGNTTVFASVSGALTSGHCIQVDASFNLIDAGAGCNTTTPIATCNTIQVSATVSITTGTKNLTATGATFTANDVGKVIAIPGAGTTAGSIHSTLNTTITAFVDATHVTVNDNAQTTVTTTVTTLTYGTDDTTSLQTALSNSALEIVDLTPFTACMVTGQLNLARPATIKGAQNLTTIYFRQTSGTAQKTIFNITSNGTTLENFNINADAGSTITSTSAGALIQYNANSQTVIKGMTIDGNGSVQLKEVTVAISNFGNFTQILNNTIQHVKSYPIGAGSAASHVLVQGNTILDGPRGSVAAAYIAFLSSGVSQIMQDVKVLGNYIDMSNLAVADMNVGIYFFGGNTTTFAYTDVQASNNFIIGTSGATASTSGGIIGQQCRNAVFSNNTIRYTGENIGSGCDQASITGNVLIGGGTYNIEMSGTIVSVTGNSMNSDGNTQFGMSVGQCFHCTVSGNSIFGTTSPSATYVGIFWFTGSGTAADDNMISNNMITLPSGAGASFGINVACVAGSVSCSHYTIVGNTIVGGGASSTGIQMAGGATTNSGYLEGPNATGQNTGISASGITGFCHVAGANASTTKTAGAAFPGTCN